MGAGGAPIRDRRGSLGRRIGGYRRFDAIAALRLRRGPRITSHRGLVRPSARQTSVGARNVSHPFPRSPHASDLTTRVRHVPQADFKFQDLLDKLPADEPRYLVLDWNVENDDGCQLSKIFFVSWVPDTCKAKTKMLYASSKQALRNALEGVHLDHQATDYDEITPEEFTSRTLGK